MNGFRQCIEIVLCRGRQDLSDSCSSSTTPRSCCTADLKIRTPGWHSLSTRLFLRLRSSVSARNTLPDIPDLSMIEAGMLLPKKIACSPHEVIQDVISLMKGAADAKGLSLDFRIEATIPQRAKTDPTRLRQLVLSLLSNAIRFTSSGSVRVTAEMNASEQLLIHVLDTGRGMCRRR